MKDGLELHEITYAEVTAGDIIVDDRWPDMFGHRVIETEARRGRVGLFLNRSAGLLAGADTTIQVLR